MAIDWSRRRPRCAYSAARRVATRHPSTWCGISPRLQSALRHCARAPAARAPTSSTPRMPANRAPLAALSPRAITLIASRPPAARLAHLARSIAAGIHCGIQRRRAFHRGKTARVSDAACARSRLMTDRRIHRCAREGHTIGAQGAARYLPLSSPGVNTQVNLCRRSPPPSTRHRRERRPVLAGPAHRAMVTRRNAAVLLHPHDTWIRRRTRRAVRARACRGPAHGAGQQHRLFRPV